METVDVLLKSASLLMKIISSPIGKEIKSIWKYESEIKRFADTVAMIGDVLSDVENKQFQDKSVKRGYKRLREAYLDAEDFLDAVEAHRKKLEFVTSKFNKEKDEMMKNANGKRKQLLANARIKKKVILIKARRFFSGSNQVKHAVKMNNAIKKIRKNLDDLEKDMNKFDLKESSITSEASNLTGYRITGSCVDADKIIGREEDKSEIVELLLSSSVDHRKIPVISIFGIGGLGKTTMAQLLYNDESWQKGCGFDLKLWVPDSKKFNVESMLKNILKSIIRNDTASVDTLQENHLRERLVEEIGGKKFLLVLDDVENEDVLIWETLESLLNYGNKEESRILVTTRSRKAVDVMGSDSSYQLRGLSENDALQLFERYAFPKRRDEDLAEIGKHVVNKCVGVPLAIKVIGSLLCGKDKHMWERVRRDIGSVIKDESKSIILILMISYYNLDSTLKQCFSYCALFSKNYLIPKEILSSIWSANVRLKNERETLEDDCEKYLKTLCDRCLLEERFGAGLFKMHDLIHDLATKIAGEEMLVLDSNAKMNSNVRHVSLVVPGKKADGSSTFEVKGRRLRTFLLLETYLQPLLDRHSPVKYDELVLDCLSLRLLDIHSLGIKNLPNSIGKLIHLRHLDLSSNEFQTLPNSVVELINLRHLNLAKCRALTRLPSGMDALTSLEKLNLSYCEKLEELPMGIEKITNLRHLDLSCRLNEGLSCMTSRIGALSSVEVLDISGRVKLEEQLKGIEKLINLRFLWFKYCGDLTHLPSGMGALTSLEFLDITGWSKLEELPEDIGKLINLEHLDISYCGNLEELPVSIEKLIKLKELRLSNCTSLTHMPSGIGELTSLETLNLFYCPKLEELPMSIEKMIKLKELNLKGCKALTHLPSGIGELTSLETLNLCYCEKLEELPVSIEKLIKLKKLGLSYCKSLTHMPPGMGSLTSLESLNVTECGKLKELPADIVKLINLKDLSLEGCKALTHLPTGISALKSLCKLDKFIVGDPESNHSAQLEELGCLSESEVRRLKIELPNNIRLKDSWDGEAFLLNMKRLTDLEIRWQGNGKDDNQMGILATLQPPPNLKCFTLDGYQGTTFSLWVPDDCFASVLPQLIYMCISNCGKIQQLPPLSRLACLNFLSLSGLSNLEYIEENVSTALFCPLLSDLKLDDIPELKGWCRGPATKADEDGKHEQSLILPSFPCLSSVKISACPKLMVEPILVSFQKVFSVNREEKHDQSSSTTPALSSSSVNLFVQVCRNGGRFHLTYNNHLTLFISNLNVSEHDPSINMVDSFREMSKHLKVLAIKFWSGLKTLPAEVQHLSTLTHLAVEDCPDFTGEEEDGYLSWKDLQSLTFLRLTKLPKMVRLPQGIQLLTSLRTLKIEHCDSLLLPEWLHKTFKSFQTSTGVYEFHRVEQE